MRSICIRPVDVSVRCLYWDHCRRQKACTPQVHLSQVQCSTDDMMQLSTRCHLLGRFVEAGHRLLTLNRPKVIGKLITTASSIQQSLREHDLEFGLPGNSNQATLTHARTSHTHIHTHTHAHTHIIHTLHDQAIPNNKSMAGRRRQVSKACGMRHRPARNIPGAHRRTAWRRCWQRP